MASSQTSRLTSLVLATATVAAATVGGAKLYVDGVIRSTGNLIGSGSIIISNDFETEATSFCIKSNGVCIKGYVEATCTGTGGNVKVNNGAKYDTCITANPLSTTGAITSVQLMMSASPFAVGIDCGFVKGLVSGTGTAFTNFDNKLSATGAIVTFGTGSLRWNSADYVKCGTLANPTSSFAAKLRIWYSDDVSE